MLQAISHGDVTRLRCSTRASRAMNYEVSAYAVRDVLIDTAFPAVADDFARWVTEARPEGALVTHYHEDHSGNVGRLVALGIPVGLAPETLARIARPAPIGWYRRLCWGSASPLSAHPAPFEHPALTLLHTPGHSADHHVVWDAERETIFGGDLFLGVKVRIAHPGEDIRGQVAELRRIAALRPKRFFDGHRGPIEQPVELLLAKAQWISDVVGAIEHHSGKGWDARTIEAEVLGARDLTGILSRGDYAKRNIVESVLAGIERADDASEPTPGPSRQ